MKFGTDGWRAIIAEDYTFENVRYAAQGVADYLNAEGDAASGLVVGYDTRFGSERFAEATAEVLAANGIKVFLADRFAPTPVVALSLLRERAAGAVVITSSHNPASYNGFKYKPEYAGSASPEIVARLEHYIGLAFDEQRIKQVGIEQAKRRGLVVMQRPDEGYEERLGRLISFDRLRQSGLKVVADPMYGAGQGYIPRLLAGGSTRVEEIHAEYNPAFPGLRAPEPIAPNTDELCCEVPRRRADVGLATDGDADRLGVVDEQGTFINQLQVYGLLALHALENLGWRGPIIKSLSTTSMVDRLGEQFGVEVIETPVGFKYIGPLMMSKHAILGGEESGGYGFKDHVPERDGVLSGLFILDMMAAYQKPLSQILGYLQEKAGPSYYHRDDYHFDPAQRDAIRQRLEAFQPEQIDGSRVVRRRTDDGFKLTLEDGSWLLLRFSGTEPLLRVYAETSSPERVQRLLAIGKQMAGV